MGHDLKPMNAKVEWKNGMAFTAESGGFTYTMDAHKPIGSETGATPKEFVAMGLCGCTAMDVASLLKKHKQTLKSMNISVDIEQTSGVHPAVFKSVLMKFDVHGEITPEILKEAVHLSQTKFCGVSAMIDKTAPIQYQIFLNGNLIGEGQSAFS